MYANIGLILNSFLMGVVTSFIVVTSPTVFKTLDEEYSKKFLRSIFPRLFNFCFLISTGMFLFFALAEFSFGMVAAIVIAVGFLINTYLLTPSINRMRDLMITGLTGSEKKFKMLHFISVLLYLISMVLIVAIFVLHYSR